MIVFHLSSFGKSYGSARPTLLPPSLLYRRRVRSNDNSDSDAAHKTTDGTNDCNLVVVARRRRWFTRRRQRLCGGGVSAAELSQLHRACGYTAGSQSTLHAPPLVRRRSRLPQERERSPRFPSPLRLPLSLFLRCRCCHSGCRSRRPSVVSLFSIRARLLRIRNQILTRNCLKHWATGLRPYTINREIIPC